MNMSTGPYKTPATTASVTIAPKALRTAHAQHNTDVCDLLISNGQYPDWVVTTAFYAAMHRVQAKVFPYTDENGKTYNNIGQYAKSLSTASRRVSKHDATKNIVKKVLHTISQKYSKLFDMCHMARYTQYQTSLAVAKQAREYLTAIEQACV